MRLPLTCSTSCVSDCGTRSKTHRSLAAHPKAALFSRTMPESPADTNAVLSINQLLDTAERLAQTQGITELWWRGHSLATWPLTDRKSTRLELQSRVDLVCRLLLEKKKKEYICHTPYKKTNNINTNLDQ